MGTRIDCSLPEGTLKSTTGGPSSYLTSLCRIMCPSSCAKGERNLFFNNGIMTNLYASSSASCSFARMPLVDDSIGPTNDFNSKSRDSYTDVSTSTVLL